MRRTLILMLLACLVIPLHAQTAKITERIAYEGTLDGKTPVRVAFEVNSDGCAAGDIYYPKAKHPAPILLVGHKNGQGYFLTEYLPDGTETGQVFLTIKKGKMTGTWNKRYDDKELTFTNMRKIVFPSKSGGKLTPESPDKIGKEYQYSFHNSYTGEDLGGSATFRGAGKNRIHFSICNVPNNIAEGESSKGRPAVLRGNTFTYDMPDCHYKFKAYFFKEFLIIENISYEDAGCFGFNATFAGTYIKVKD